MILLTVLIALNAGLKAQTSDVVKEDFEGAMASEDWVADMGVWQIGTPNPQYVYPVSGTNVLSTGLFGHTAPLASRIAGPSWVVPSASENPRLRFWHYYLMPSRTLGQVHLKPGTNDWVQISPDYAGTSGNWTQTSFDLAAYAGQRVQIGFYYYARDAGSVGWFIDDVRIVTGEIPSMLNPENFERPNVGEEWIADFGVWQVGTPNPQYLYPMSGTNVLSTGLYGHTAPIASFVAGPSCLVPPASENPRLRFWHYYLMPSRTVGQVFIKPGTNEWVLLSPNYSGTSGNWTQTSFDLAAYEGQSIRVGFYYYARDAGSVGWFIDDVRIVTGEIPSMLNPENFERPTAGEEWISDFGVWEVGTPNPQIASPASGTNVLCTGPSGHTAPIASLVAGPSCLVPPASDNPRLRFWHYYLMPSRTVGQVFIKPGTNEWTQISPDYSGTSGNWTQTAFDLAAYAGQSIRVGFYYYARDAGGAGWFIDDVRISSSTPNNRVPSFDAIEIIKIEQGQTASFTAKASDPDSGQTLTYSLVEAPPGVSINASTGEITWKPTLQQCGNSFYSIKVQATDNGNPPLSAFQTITIRIIGGLRLTVYRNNPYAYAILQGGDDSQDYYLQESADLRTWTTVAKFMKPGNSFTFISPRFIAPRACFWRILIE